MLSQSKIWKLELAINYGYDKHFVAKEGKVISFSLTFFEIKLSISYKCRKAIRDSYNCREAVRDTSNCREAVRDSYNCWEAVRDSYNCRETDRDSSLLKKSCILLLQLIENLFFKKKEWYAVLRCHLWATTFTRDYQI